MIKARIEVRAWLRGGEVGLRDEHRGGDPETQLGTPLAELRAELATSRALPVEGVLDRALVRRHSVSDRLADGNKAGLELGSREDARPVPVAIESSQIEAVIDEEGVDLQKQLPLEAVLLEPIDGASNEEENSVQILEGDIVGGLVDHLTGAGEQLLELAEELLPRLLHGTFSLKRYRSG